MLLGGGGGEGAPAIEAFGGGEGTAVGGRMAVRLGGGDAAGAMSGWRAVPKGAVPHRGRRGHASPPNARRIAR
jgi:hypothetical protein